MAGVCRIINVAINTIQIPKIATRLFSLSATNHLKEIRETKLPKELVIEGVYVKSPREDFLIKPDAPLLLAKSGEKKEPCYLCALDLDLKHTDVEIISQFVRTDGCMLPKRITKLCYMQQKRVAKLVQMAHKAGLMMNLTPANCKRDPRLRDEHKKYNTYYDENTIFAKKKQTWLQKFKHLRPLRVGSYNV